MGSSLPAAPALGPQHPPGMLALTGSNPAGLAEEGEVQSPVFRLLDSKNKTEVLFGCPAMLPAPGSSCFAVCFGFTENKSDADNNITLFTAC